MAALKLPGFVKDGKYIEIIKTVGTLASKSEEVKKALGSLKSMAEKLKTLTFDKKPEVTALYNGLIVSLMGGIEQDLTEGSDGSLKNTTTGMNNAKTYFETLKEQMKDKKELKTKFKGHYAAIKAKIIEKMKGEDMASIKKNLTEIQNALKHALVEKSGAKSLLLKTLPSSLLLFMIEEKSEEATNQALGNFTVDEAAKITEAAKKAVETKTAASTEKPVATTTKTTATTKEEPKTGFGKRKRGPSASLKRMCKKHGVRLMVKRGKKRVYKSSKVLKEQCQRKLKRKLKKNFGRKKIKRSGIMPPRKRKTRGKKRRKQKGGAAKLAQILKASARRQAKRAGRGARSAAKRARRRASSVARYARRNKGRIAAGLAGLGALGLGGLEARRARGRYLLDKDNADLLSVKDEIRRENLGQEGKYQEYLKKRAELESPTGRFVRGVKEYPYRKRAEEAYEGVTTYPYGERAGGFYRGAKAAPRRAYEGAKSRASSGYDYVRNLFKRKKTPTRAAYGKRRRRRRKFGAKKEGCGHTGYGKRRRKKRSFGKKAKKPSAATRRMCKKLKVRLTLKRGGKRVYKSEAMLKKQCKKAMKRKKKKSKK